MPISKQGWINEVRYHAARLKAQAREEREARKGDITLRWKNGFRALKEENDRLQRESEEKYKKDITDIDAESTRRIAGGPGTPMNL